MRFSLAAPIDGFLDATCWSYPTQGREDPGFQIAHEQYLAELGLTPPAAPVLAPDEAKMNEERWAVFVEQGVPLRDPAALLWFAKREFYRQLKRSKWTSDAVYRTVSETQRVAGGVLPVGLPNLTALVDSWAEPAKKVRAKREKFRAVANGVVIKPSLVGKFQTLIQKEATQAIKAANFRRPRSDRPPETRVVLNNERVRLSGVSAAMEVEKNGRRNTYTVRVRIDTRWYRTVFRAGLANIFGDGTLVLKADVTGSGTRLTVARQPKTETIVVEEGWLSLDKNNNRIFKKD